MHQACLIHRNPGVVENGLFLEKRRRKTKLVASTGKTTMHFESQISRASTREKHTRFTSMKVQSPQLQSAQTCIWGMKEALILSCQITDQNGEPVAGRKVRADMKDDGLCQFVTDNQGICKITHIFNDKGTYIIEFFSDGDDEYSGCGQQLKIRIVDYREEAISLYHCMKGSITSKGITVTGQSTPRDVETILLARFKLIDREKLGRFIDYVEEALYSPKHFDSDQYSDMLWNYLANSDVVNNELPMDLPEEILV